MGVAPLSVHRRRFGTVELRRSSCAAVVSVLCLDGTAALGLRLRHVSGPVRMDTRAARPVFSHAFGVALVPVHIAQLYVRLGNPIPYLVVVALVVALCVGLRDWLMLGVSTVVPVLAVWGAERLKTYVGRSEGGVDALPSGHTTATTAIAVLVVLIVWRRWGRRPLPAVVVAATVLASGMVLTVVRLHAHLMSDALAGVLLGAGVAVGGYSVASLLDLTLYAGRRSAT